MMDKEGREGRKGLRSVGFKEIYATLMSISSALGVGVGMVKTAGLRRKRDITAFIVDCMIYVLV